MNPMHTAALIARNIVPAPVRQRLRRTVWDLKPLRRDQDGNPNTRDVWNRQWSDWAGSGDLEAKLEGKERYPRIVSALGSSLEGATVLDVGCGTGFLAKELIGTGVRSYVGFDFSEAAIGIARREVADPRFTFVHASISDFDVFAYPRFDVVTIVDFLEHQYLDVAESVLRTYVTHCRELILATPYRGSTPNRNRITEYDPKWFQDLFRPYNGELHIELLDGQREIFARFRWKAHVPRWRA